MNSKKTKALPVLFWLAQTDEKGDLLTFCFFFEGEEEYVTPFEAHDTMTNAQNMNFPIICVN